MLANVTALINHSGKAREAAQAAAEDRKRRAAFSFSEGTGSRYVWLRDPDEEFIVAKVVEERPDETVAVEIGTARQSKVVRKQDVAFPIFRPSTLRTNFDDMVKMEDVNDATILHNLRQRFMEDQIYTNIGTILVAVNPFKFIPALYTESVMQQQLAVGAGESSEPHIFGIAAAAFRGLKSESQDQSIIISGESGAGKTEATKKCLQFLASAAGSATGDGMEQRLLAANPILEAFGNAKTVRNNNSSRFGKWMVVHFNVRGQICGSEIVNYLLEKSRVTAQAPSERNYHGFYQLCASGDMAKRFELGPADDYMLLNQSGCTVVPNMPDDDEFVLTCESIWQITSRKPPEDLDASPRPPPDYECIMQLVAAVLHLGNISFEALTPDDPRSDCRLASDDLTVAALRSASRLLGVEPSRLASALTMQERQTASERVESPLELSQAAAAKGSLAKTLYGRMFDWLVRQVNVNIAGDLDSSLNVIGVLDIFGFEIFEHNSFEQLCINFCNEKLQQHFNAHVFKEEEKCYIAEGIDYSEVEFEDNQDVLDVIEKPPGGILIVLDDQTKSRGRGSDTAFLNHIKRGLAKAKRFAMPSARERGLALPFGVHHYAGKVMYDAEGFLEKNKDEMMLQLRELCTVHTRNDFIQELFAAEAEELGVSASAGSLSGAASPTTARKRSVKDTQGSQFRKQLDSLMGVLNKTFPHYVRCVKSNSVKKPRIFESGLCLRQLRYAGVFEAVKIRQRGFPFRWTHADFYKRYRCCARERSRFLERISPGANFTDLAANLLEDLTTTDPESRPDELVGPLRACKMGKTMVLYRAEPNRILEMMREVVRSRSAAVVCRVYRGHAGRVRFRLVLAARDALLAATKARDLERLTAAVEQAQRAPFVVRQVAEAERLRSRLQDERDCRSRLASLAGSDPVDAFEEYKEAIAWADRLELTGEDVQAVKGRFATVRDRKEAKEELSKGIRNGDRLLIETAMAKVRELSESWGPIVPAETLRQAEATLEVIRKEDEALAGLRAAVSDPAGSLLQAKEVARREAAREAGSDGGGAGAAASAGMGIGVLSTDLLDAAMARARDATVSTKVGKDLIKTAELLVELRSAFKAGPDWERVEAAVAAAVAARDEHEGVSREALAEVARAEAEVNDRKFVALVESALKRGRATGPVGELDTAHCDPDVLTPVIERGESLGEDLSPPNRALLEVARLMRRLRVALKAHDFASVRRCVGEAMRLLVPGVAVEELRAAKEEADDHAICAQLHDALSRGGAEGTVGALDGSTAELELLNSRLEHTADLGPQTARAEALFDAGEAVLRLRAALKAGRSAAVPGLLGEAERAVGLVAGAHGEPVPMTPGTPFSPGMQSPSRGPVSPGVGGADGSQSPASAAAATLRGFMPPAVIDEVRLVRQDLDNDTILRGLGASLCEGRARGVVGDLDASSAEVQGLQAAIAQATRLVCRTEEARWLFEVAEAVAELRVAMVAGEWARLQELLGAVRAMDGVCATRIGGAGARSGRRRVVSNARRAHPNGPLIGLDSFRRIAGVATAAAALAAARHGNKPATPPHGGHADGASFAEGERSRSASDPSSSGPAGSTDRETFCLPGPVNEELALVQGEIDNRLILETVSRALARGQASGPIGKLDVTRVDLDDLEVTVARASTLNPSTEQAKSIVESGLRVLSLRRALVAEDWAQVEILLAGMALTAEDARSREELAKAALAASGPLAAQRQKQQQKASAALGVQPRSLVPQVVVVAPAASDEVKRISDEVAYRRVLAEMTEALAVGGPSGVVGNVQTSGVSTERLDTAIDTALRFGTPTERATHLLDLCRLVWKLRRALLDGLWDHVEAVLEDPATVGVLGGPSRPLPAECEVPPHSAAEIALLRGEAENKRAVRALVSAIAEGRPTGDTGHLAIGLVDVRPLEDAIELALRLGAPTAHARCLVATCLHVRSWRLALMAGQWSRLGSLLEYAEEVRRRWGPGPLPRAQELAEASFAASTRTAASQDGRAAGQLGSPAAPSAVAAAGSAAAPAAAGSAEPGPAAEGAGAASGPGPLAGPREAALRAEAARAIGAIGNDADLDAVLEEEEDEEEEEEDAEHAARAAAAGDEGAAEGLAQPTEHAEQQAHAQAQLPLPGESGSWRFVPELLEELSDAAAISPTRRPPVPLPSPGFSPPTFALAVEGVAREALPEMRVCRAELNNRNAIVALTRAVSQGAATGQTGHLDVSCVDVEVIDAALDRAAALGLETAEASQMAETARVVRSVRAALKSKDWSALESALVAAQGRVIADIVADEIRVAQDELDNRAVLLELQDALGRGRAQGETGRLYTGSIELRPLEEAIDLATRLGCRTPEARHMLFSAKVCLRLRHALLSGDFKEAQLTLEAIRGKPLATVALSEVRTVQDEVDNWAVVSSLASALASGRAGGAVGSLDLSVVDTEQLRAALARADELGVKTREAQSLVVGGRFVLDMRLALQEGDWAKLDRVVRAAAEATPLAEQAAAELAAASDELDNRRVIEALSGALQDSDGAASGAPGAMELGTVDTSRLDRAIATAVDLGCKTSRASDLLAACKLIRRLRSTLLARNWDWVASVLEDARSSRGLFDEGSLRELQLAQDELDNRLVLARLASALRTGGAAVSSSPARAGGHRRPGASSPPSRSPGSASAGSSSPPKGGDASASQGSLLDLDGVDTAPLDDAIDFAESLGCRTIEASQMLATARLVRRLRQALLAGALDSCRDLLDGVRGRVLAAVAAEEVQAIKHEVDDWTVVSELTAALQTGAATAGAAVGDVDVSKVSAEALDEAIPLAMRLGCHTPEARRCLETALIVRRARQAMLDSDWPLLRETLVEADAISPTPCSRPELRVLRDELDLRDILEELASAADSLDEAALGSALSRAARLGLATHPRAEIRNPVGDAQGALTRLQRCKASLTAARRAMSAAQLVDALAMAATVGYAGPLVRHAQEALEAVRAATERATKALKDVDTAAMEAALAECESLGVALPLLTEMRHLLALPRHEYLHRQLAAAVRQGDEDRVAELTMEIKRAYFLGPDEEAGADVAANGADAAAAGAAGGPKPLPSRLERFALHRCPLLKPPHLYASYPLSAPRLEQRMTSWQPGPASTSLCRINDASERRSAVRAFRCVQTFMGDRPGAKPIEAGIDAVERAVASARGRDAGTTAGQLADEVALQVMKQLSRNPHPESRTRGWVLLGVLLGAAPPSEELEHFVEAFLRRAELLGKAKTPSRTEADAAAGSLAAAGQGDGPMPESGLAHRCLRAMHVALFRGPAEAAPAPSVVAAALEAAGAPATPSMATKDAVRVGLIPAAIGKADSSEPVPATWEALEALRAGRFVDPSARTISAGDSPASASKRLSPLPPSAAARSPSPASPPQAPAAEQARRPAGSPGAAASPGPGDAPAPEVSRSASPAQPSPGPPPSLPAASGVGTSDSELIHRIAAAAAAEAAASRPSPPPARPSAVPAPRQEGGPRAAPLAPSTPSAAAAKQQQANNGAAASNGRAVQAPPALALLSPAPAEGTASMGMVSFGDVSEAFAAKRRKRRQLDSVTEAVLANRAHPGAPAVSGSGNKDPIVSHMSSMARRLRGVQ
ncbi:hypothetical protein FNF31_01856 [Cafeteria roenbergensis]|uniref:Myosin motor domain-containing protein n=6 Tax=Cafeteria roenbergensis TaxID=33653 RepID=A0A5A8DNR0_CAFRO|nr:hypothetical protein FNF31_01856 [Cafeteria roenbergensis]